MKPTITFRYELFDVNKDNPTLHDAMHLDRNKIGNLVGVDESRFRFSQVVDSMFYYYQTVTDTDDTLNVERIDSDSGNNYIIPIAVAYHPDDWTDTPQGIKHPTKKSVFEYLHPKFLEDLRNKKALLLIDQSVEGYGTIWLWDWFHNKCREYGLDPACIIYLTGDQSCSDHYNEWCKKTNPSTRLKVVPSTSLGMYIHKHYHRSNLNIKFDELLKHKKEHANSIYLYDCINLRPRPQRVLNFLHLLNAGLLDQGNISMSDQKEWDMYVKTNADYLSEYKLPTDIMSRLDSTTTPRVAKHKHSNDLGHYYNFVERVLDDMYRNSWVSVVTESSYFNFEHAVFIGEKTFKPMACQQPFIILGSRGTLKYLRKLGYRTFHPFIDESYDDLDDADRFVAVTDAIKKIQAIEDKVAWYESIRDVVEHNHQLFLTIDTRKSSEHEAVTKYYFEYFEEHNVQDSLRRD